MLKVILQFLVAISFFLLAGCGLRSDVSENLASLGERVDVSGGAYYDISVPELESMLDNKDFTMVNVHIPFEGDLPNTDISIPYDQIDQNLDKLPVDKDARIVLYCRSGRMSSIAAETLVNLGYTNIFNLDGGMVEWEKAGLPVLGK